jgi:adenylyltransferase/sulfurtransferase
LRVIDRDFIETSNLQRQVLFDERDVAEGLPKAEAARRRLAAVNSAIRIEAVVADFNAGNAERILRDLLGGMPVAPHRHVLLDGTDNFETRYLLNDLAVKHGIPYCYGGVVGTRGMQMTVVAGGPCLRCIFETPPSPGSQPTCDTAGVLGPVVSVIAACQATDALKLLVARPDLTSKTLLELDLWNNERRRLDISNARRPDCPCCGERRFEFLSIANRTATAALCGQNAVQVYPYSSGESRLDLVALAERLRSHGAFEVGRYFLRGELADSGQLGLTVFPDGRAIVRGTDRVDVARGIYAKFVGN